MRKSTNKLTKHELAFASDTQYPLLKHRIMFKTNEMFHQTAKQLNEKMLESGWFEGKEYKITKGENHQKMPYIVVDCPQIKSADFSGLFRVMFWWGHYFTLSLYVRTELVNLLQTAAKLRQVKNTYLLKGDNLWTQDVNGDDYVKLHKLTAKQFLKHVETKPYLKLVRKVNIKRFKEIPELASDTFTDWTSVIVIKSND